MAISIRQLRVDAQNTLMPQLNAARRLVLISQGVIFGVNLLLSLLEVLLELMMDSNGGLSGMALRSVLSTVTALSSLAASFLIPFWSIGLTFAFLHIARQQTPETGALLEGFNRFGPFLRYSLLKVLIITGVTFGVCYVFMMLVSFLPTNPELTAIILENQDAFLADPEATLAQFPRHLLLEAMLPGLLILAALLLVVMVPLMYRLQLGDYAIMDKPGTGAFAAISFSMRTMKGNCLKAFKLDLHFWWYGLATGALVALSQLDTILPALGVALPVSSSISHLICYALYAAGALVFNWHFMPLVQTTYTKFYLTLKGE